MSPTRAAILARIDACEALSDVKHALDDLSNVQWGEFETQAIDIHASKRDDGRAVAFVLGLPPSVLAAGLKAMERELMQLADMREVAHG